MIVFLKVFHDWDHERNTETDIQWSEDRDFDYLAPASHFFSFNRKFAFRGRKQDRFMLKMSQECWFAAIYVRKWGRMIGSDGKLTFRMQSSGETTSLNNQPKLTLR